MRGSSAISDHFLVKIQVKIRLSVERQKRTALPKRMNIEALKNQSMERQHKKRLTETLQSIQDTDNLDEIWNITQSAIKKVANGILGFEDKRDKNKWFDESCKKVMAERDLARIEVLKTPIKSNKRTLATKQREAKCTIRRKKREWEKRRLEMIEDSYKGNTKLLFDKANEIKTGFKTRSTIMRNEDGSLITEKAEVANEFKNVFEKMLNQSTQNESGENCTTVEQYLQDPTEKEVEQEINMLKNGKAPGEDEIAAELLKKGGKPLVTKLKQLIEKI